MFNYDNYTKSSRPLEFAITKQLLSTNSSGKKDYIQKRNSQTISEGHVSG